MAEIACPADEELQAFLLGELPERLGNAIARHLELCPDCEVRAGHWDARCDAAIRALRRPAPDPAAPTSAVPADLTADGATDRAAPALPGPPSPAGYTVLGELGRGGMGVVYKARQLKANRLVALKMLLARAHASLEQKVRFQIEVEAVARFQHPHIVQLYEVGEHDGQPFFSLELCEGGALDRNCLLYTSPSPRDGLLSRMPSSA